MKSIKIISQTKKGEKALKKHTEESVKLRRDKRAMFKVLGFSQEIICKEPLTLEISLRNKRLAAVVNPKHITQQIEETMKENGADVNIDFIVEVE